MTNILLDVKTVEGYEQRIAELEAERNEWHRMWEEQGAINDRNSRFWKAEQDRLREALQTIADECEIEFQYAADVARGALKEQT